MFIWRAFVWGWALQVVFVLTWSADVRCITDAIRHSDCVIVCTDWDEFKCIDWRAMASEMQVGFESVCAVLCRFVVVGFSIFSHDCFVATGAFV